LWLNVLVVYDEFKEYFGEKKQDYNTKGFAQIVSVKAQALKALFPGCQYYL